MYNNKLFLFVLLAIAIQCWFTLHFNIIQSFFPFLDGVPVVSAFILENRYLLNWYLPIFSMSLYFSGILSRGIRGYNELLLTRGYSKSKWVLNQFFSVMFILFLFVVFQLLINSFRFLQGYTFSVDAMVKLTILYYLTLLVIFSIQILLDLYVTPQFTHLMVNIYIVSSIIATNQTGISRTGSFLIYLSIPNYGMGFRNGLTTFNEENTNFIDYRTALIILVIVQIFLIVMTLKKMKKSDFL